MALDKIVTQEHQGFHLDDPFLVQLLREDGITSSVPLLLTKERVRGWVGE